MSEEGLAVWMEGFPEPAGLLARSENGNTSFAYNPGYIAEWPGGAGGAAAF